VFPLESVAIMHCKDDLYGCTHAYIHIISASILFVALVKMMEQSLLEILGAPGGSFCHY
jgi:hypothetical protein